MKTKLEIAGVLMVVVALAGCGESETEKRARAEADAACKADIQCLGARLTTSPEVGLICGNEIERVAAREVTWTATLLQQRFSRASWGSDARDRITLKGDAAKIKNDIGDYVPMVYQCELNLDGTHVIAARGAPGQL